MLFVFRLPAVSPCFLPVVGLADVPTVGCCDHPSLELTGHDSLRLVLRFGSLLGWTDSWWIQVRHWLLDSGCWFDQGFGCYWLAGCWIAPTGSPFVRLGWTGPSAMSL